MDPRTELEELRKRYGSRPTAAPSMRALERGKADLLSEAEMQENDHYEAQPAQRAAFLAAIAAEKDPVKRAILQGAFDQDAKTLPDASSSAGALPPALPPQSGPRPSGMPTDVSGQPAPPYQPGALSQTLKQMGSEMSGPGKVGLGLAQSGDRTARALMIPQAVNALGGRMDEGTGAAFDAAAEGAGGLATAGDLAGTVAQAIPGGAGVAKLVPSAVKAAMKNFPKVAAYLGGGANAAATTALMTPGDVGERAKQGAIAAATALPVTALARGFSKPVQMSAAGQNIRAATGEIPPVHVGAESKLLRDVGDVLEDIPGIGAPLVAGEKRIFDAGLRQLWGHATPPGKPNLVSAGGKIERGPIFEQLKIQFDDTYNTLLKNQRIGVSARDRNALVAMVDRELVPADAAKVHKILDNYFPQHSGTIGGKSWKELQEIIRSHEGKFGGSTMASDKTIGDVLGKVDDYLIKMRNRSVPRDIAQALDDTDRAYGSRKLLEKAIASPGGEKGLNPSMLAKALRDRTSEAALARGHGTGQPLIDPLASALGNMTDKNTGQALWGLRRLMLPTLAAGMAGGVSGAMVPAGVMSAAALVGSGRKGAKVLFGETEMQKKVAELLRKYPTAIPAGSAALDLQAQE